MKKAKPFFIERNVYLLWTVLLTVINVVIIVLLGVFVREKIAFAVWIVISVNVLNISFSFWIVNSKKRTTRSKMTWLLVFLVFPVLGLIIFAIWGRNPYRFRTREDYQRLNQEYLKHYNYHLLHALPDSDFLAMATFNYNTCFEPVFGDTDAQVLPDGVAFYNAVMDAVDGAEHTICLQYYILNKGFFFNILMGKILLKADAGVEVYILYDWWGCIGKFDEEIMASLLTHPHIHVATFDSLSDYRIERSTTNFRSHRKFLIVDDSVAVYGGSNIGDEYLSTHNDFNNWMDLNFVVHGSLVRRFLASFATDWEQNSQDVFIWKYALVHWSESRTLRTILRLRKLMLRHQHRHLSELIEKKPRQDRDLFATFVARGYIHFQDESVDDASSLASFVNTGPIYYKSILTEQIVAAISRANHSIKIITPYLNPNDEIFTALKSASMSGVKVQIIVPGVRNTQWYLLYMNRMNYWKLSDSEVQILEYDGFIHSKLILVDNHLTLVGTFNLDLRSLSSNFESMLIMESEAFNHRLTTYFQTIQLNTWVVDEQQLLKKQSLGGQLITYLLKLIQPLL